MLEASLNLRHSPAGPPTGPGHQDRQETSLFFCFHVVETVSSIYPAAPHTDLCHQMRLRMMPKAEQGCK